MSFGFTPAAGRSSSYANLTERSAAVGQRFRGLYGITGKTFRAPGRVNLIGEHTDYNQGFVMPVAMELSCWVVSSPTRNRQIEVYSCNVEEHRIIDLDHPTRSGDWSDYVQGVALMLEDAGHHFSGAKLLVGSDLPMGGGLSSSAALEVAVGLALLDSQPIPCDPLQLALACQRAENEFVGARCGIMDQFIATHARTGHAVELDCRSLEHRYLPLPSGVDLVTCNTMVKHSVAQGEYNRRRAECEEAVQLLCPHLPDLRSLRNLTLADLEHCREQLSPTIYKRSCHVVTENQRVQDAAVALEQADLGRLGELMAASHRSLRDDYEVSCPELDLLVDLATGITGVHGARMTGGGFGGCTVNLVSTQAVPEFLETMVSAYHRQTGITPEIYVTAASDAAGGWEMPS